MRSIMAAIAVLGMFGAIAASTPARADEDDYDGGWRHHEWHERQRQEQRWHEQEWRERQAYAPPVAYAPPGYYRPAPAYYGSPDAYYAAPPAYYAPPPRPIFEEPGLSIGFSFR